MSNKFRWGSAGISQGTTADTRGSGKTNSATLLSKFGDSNKIIWNWLKGLRDSNYNGCNDWFIGSTVELNDLRTGSAPGKSIFKSNDIWSSVERNQSMAFSWSYDTAAWVNDRNKGTELYAVALRAF